MCKEMPVIPVDRVVDKKRIIRKKGRAEEVKSHKGSLTQKSKVNVKMGQNVFFYHKRLLSAGLGWPKPAVLG
jgi:hypothetical protein